uniref:Uncharacterized protein n=1 Tax=Anguilla anguilla TaxID=7936 RepID=A0A0E9UDS9_ANGAN
MKWPHSREDKMNAVTQGLRHMGPICQFHNPNAIQAFKGIVHII